ADWVHCSDIHAMVGHLPPDLTERQFRRHACYCCRRLLSMINCEPAFVSALQTAEDYLEGAATAEELERAHRALFAIDYRDSVLNGNFRSAVIAATWTRLPLTRGMTWRDALSVAIAPLGHVLEEGPLRDQERRAQATLLREIFGSPFRPVTVNPAW